MADSSWNPPFLRYSLDVVKRNRDFCTHMHATSVLAPVTLPEFGRAFTWAACRNPMCEHFGVPYTGPLPAPGGAGAEDLRYRLESNRAGVMSCKYCELLFHLGNNRAIRPIARYFLSLSLPFADCPAQDCPNHGVNVFEHYPADAGRGGGHYSRAGGDHRVACKACRGQAYRGADGAGPFKFTLGTARRKGEVNKRLKQRLRQIIEDVLRGTNVTNRLEGLATLEMRRRAWQGARPAINPDAYYNQLHALGQRLRDYTSWCMAHLLAPDTNIDWESPARVYTDVLKVSLQQLGDGPRYQYLNIIVSVLGLEKTHFILAAHPAFIPSAHSIEPQALLRRPRNDDPRGYLDVWHCLDHPGKVDQAKLRQVIEEGNLPDLGRDGYFIVSPYVEAAHFLVVDKLLARFPKVYYTMDAARELSPAALCALARPVAERRVEIALFQHDKDSKEKYTGRPATDKRQVLERAQRAMEARARRKLDKAQGSLLGAGQAREQARLFKDALRGGYSKDGGGAWLRYPPDSRQYRNCRSLWLTRMPRKTFAREGAGLLLQATLQPVDSAMNAMRQRVNAIRRPAFRAIPGRSYAYGYYLVESVLSELWIYLLYHNFNLRPKTRRTFIPANKLGLITDKQAARALSTVAADEYIKQFLDFRLGLDHARKMSTWQRP